MDYICTAADLQKLFSSPSHSYSLPKFCVALNSKGFEKLIELSSVRNLAAQHRPLTPQYANTCI